MDFKLSPQIYLTYLVHSFTLYKSVQILLSSNAFYMSCHLTLLHLIILIIYW